MKKLLVVMVALIGLTIVDMGTAQAAQRGWRRRSRVTYVPAPLVTVAQGQATGTGYRTFSYEPAPATYRYTPSMQGPSRSSGSFGDATRKALGRY